MKEAAESHLKFFLEKGYPLRGVVHVGANDGAEVPWYVDQGLKPILCFDPHPEAVARARERLRRAGSVTYIQCALGSKEANLAFTIPEDGDDEKTSRYKPIPTEGHEWTKVAPGEKITVPVVRFDEWVAKNRIDCAQFNALVIDAQGMEFEVLQGFGDRLNFFDFLCVEMSAKPVYRGEVPAQKVIAFLVAQGFYQESEVQEHDDVMFVREILRKTAMP